MLGNLLENQLSPDIGQQVSHWDMAGFSPDAAVRGGNNSGGGLEISNLNDNNSHTNPVTSMDY